MTQKVEGFTPGPRDERFQPWRVNVADYPKNSGTYYVRHDTGKANALTVSKSLPHPYGSRQEFAAHVAKCLNGYETQGEVPTLYARVQELEAVLREITTCGSHPLGWKAAEGIARAALDDGGAE